MAKKPDATEIASHLESLPKQLSLDGARKWWPRYVFHSAHVENAASILNNGSLVSRARIATSGKLVKDSASSQLITGLPGGLKNLVRLYFRPRAPTQYRNQGVRPRQHYYRDAHMPVPVYFLFDAKEVLGQADVGFTKGRLEFAAQIGKDADFFKSIPFKDVYHDSSVGPMGTARRSEILNARHAEVVVPNELDLGHLKFVVCRSAPEQTTLLHLLTPAARGEWQSRIILEGPQRLFFKEFGTFLERVELSSTRSRFRFYSGVWPHWRGPFEVEIEWSAPGWNPIRKYESFEVSSDWLRFKLVPPRPRYTVVVRMDGDLVYASEWVETKKAQVFE